MTVMYFGYDYQLIVQLKKDICTNSRVSFATDAIGLRLKNESPGRDKHKFLKFTIEQQKQILFKLI